MSVSAFDEETAVKNIKELFNVTSLEPFGYKDNKIAFLAAGAIVDYIIETQKGQLPKFDVIQSYSLSEFVSIDASTRRNLELIETSRDKSKYGSLYWAIDKVKTPMGSRLLKNWITQPVKNIEELNNRLEAVEELISNTTARINLISLTDKICDIERLGIKISNGSVNPRDFLALKETFALFPNFESIFRTFNSKYLNNFTEKNSELVEFASIIGRTIDDNTPLNVKDGGVIKSNVNGDLDYYRSLLTGGEEWLKNFAVEPREITGISTLKVNYNRNFGFIIEVTKSN